MPTNKENFARWYSEPLRRLWQDEHANFVILMIALPLLERYLRRLSNSGNRKKVNDAFYQELVNLFPDLREVPIAKMFWAAYRFGLLHQASPMLIGDAGEVSVHSDASRPVIIANRLENGWTFQVNSVEFSKTILEKIEEDLERWEGRGSRQNPVAGVIETAGTSGVSGI